MGVILHKPLDSRSISGYIIGRSWEDTDEGATMVKAFGYLRVSGKGQADGHGLDRQRDTIERFAKRAKYQIVRFYEDIHTGTVDAIERPGFASLVAGMNTVRTIVVERMDRVARSVVVQEHTVTWLAAHGIQLIVADTGENVTKAYLGDPMKKALVQMQAVFGELDKSIIVKKLRAAREQKRKQTGEKVEGAKAYGEVDPKERETVNRIRELRRKRKGLRRMGCVRIARHLEAEGYPTRRGGKWQASTVLSIIRGPVYEELGRRKRRKQ
ncbi:MAG: recombinase family protein [Candidatus Brocadiae bacterium]|nr:recombinase family protein [Candidatus Brocadiia bacterium]